MQQFSARLASLMNEYGTSQYTLGKAIGVARQSIAQYLDGKTQPNAEKICAIADYFQVSSDYLLGRVDYRSANIDVQGICKKTCLWDDTAKKLIDIKEQRQIAIIGEHSERLTDAEEIPNWMYDAFSLYINYFILDESTPLLAAKSFHVVDAIEKNQSFDLETLDKARAAVAEVDPDFRVLAPAEEEKFYRNIMEEYVRKINTRVIERIKESLLEDEYNAET